MLNLILALALSSVVYAQDVGVKVNNISTDQDTTISIKKGDSTAKKKYSISEGQDDLSGEKDVLKKTAEQNWKKACVDFKAELKENNKDNKIISVSCGNMTCTKEGIESVCQSKASYKIRVLSEE